MRCGTFFAPLSAFGGGLCYGDSSAFGGGRFTAGGRCLAEAVCLASGGSGRCLAERPLSGGETAVWRGDRCRRRWTMAEAGGRWRAEAGEKKKPSPYGGEGLKRSASLVSAQSASPGSSRGFLRRPLLR